MMKMKTPNLPNRLQNGAALVVGLVLLLVITMLAVSSMNTSTVQLMMSGNKQFAESAFQAAETGINRALMAGSFNTKLVNTVPEALVSTAYGRAKVASETAFEASTPVPGGGFSIGGDDTFKAYHFEVVSTGRAERASASRHRQSFYVIGPGG